MLRLGVKLSFGGKVNLGKGARWQELVPPRTPRGIILHTSEQTPNPNDGINADNLCSALSRPGTTPNSSGGTYGAGYHAVTDSDPFGWWDITPDDQARTNSAPDTNSTHLHLCIPNRIIVNGILISRETWLAEPLRTHVKIAAEYIVSKSRQYSIPIQRVTSSQLASGKLGYADHQTVSLAFGKTNHIDVGSTFPWDVLALDIDALLAPPIPVRPLPGEGMLDFVRHNNNAFVVFNGGKYWVPTDEAWVQLTKDFGHDPVNVDRVYMEKTGPVVGPWPGTDFYGRG